MQRCRSIPRHRSRTSGNLVGGIGNALSPRSAFCAGREVVLPKLTAGPTSDGAAGPSGLGGMGKMRTPGEDFR